MKNEVTVTLSMPWMDTLDPAKFDTLYHDMFDMAKDTSALSYVEAGHVVSAMAQKKAEYSYDTPPADIDFDAYANLSRYVPDGVLEVRISKVGEHIHAGPRDDARYYNVILAEFKSGRMESQVLGHLEPDCEIEDAVTLTGQQMKSKFLSLRTVAQAEAEKHAEIRQAPVLNEEIVKQSDGENLENFEL